DAQFFAIKPGNNEAIEPFVISAAIIREQSDRDRLAKFQSLDAVGAEMHTGSVPCKRDVAGELVGFTTKSEGLTTPGVKPSAVCRCLYCLAKLKVFVHEGLQHGGTGPGIHPMGGGVGWMCRTTFRKGHGQQIGAVCRFDTGHSIALYYGR